MNNPQSKTSIISFYWPLFFLATVLFAQQAWVNGFFHDGYLYASFGRNAALKGFWLIPHYTEEVYSRFFQHTPLVFILEGIFFKIFGVSNTSARLFVSGFSIATATLLIYWISMQKDKKRKWWPWMSVAVFLLIPPLIKKSRFVNLDIPLMFFTSAALFFYWRAFTSNRHYYGYGIFFGLSLLTKGPMGLFIPMITTTHLLLTGKLKEHLFKYLLAITLGFLIFSIWPIALHMTENFDIFLNYLKFTFRFTIQEGRNATENNLFLYFIFLLKQCPLWFGLAILSLWHCVKEFKKVDTLFLLFVCSFWIPLICLSFFKHKYSHYLIPIYPAMAALSGYYAQKLSNKWKQNLYNGLKIFSLALALILLIFPITTNIRRDVDVFKILTLTNYLPKAPRLWIIVNNALPFYNTAGVLAWEKDIPVIKMSSKNILKLQKKDTLLIIDKSLWKKWKSNNTHKKRWKIFATFSSKNLIILLDKKLWSKHHFIIQ